ncbi:uncharacterized protein MYCFIDRAFT_192407 [Pseudocercospora fijiensis CIRAD86]|uniref:Uncharacterized protein n=1 Tax=Pseudocercospora fijiensis (strain CIRAD86) TaxID=383855 RepID=N1Q6P8_PSEFD|nr:uncharacterized protein MYCFIDRAFT_192407 [Pseudocercospora fijiensis CIRAD86]EME88169.1 hypothetical protein MYCFIDRAFT_192407 [Pseudocercospora fijiensis CIRAD86]
MFSMDAISAKLLPTFLRDMGRALASKDRRVEDVFHLGEEKMRNSRSSLVPTQAIEKVPGTQPWREGNANSSLSIILAQDPNRQGSAKADALSLADRLYLAWHSETVGDEAEEPVVVAEESTVLHAILQPLCLVLWSGLVHCISSLASLLGVRHSADPLRVTTNYDPRPLLPQNEDSNVEGTSPPHVESPSEEGKEQRSKKHAASTPLTAARRESTAAAGSSYKRIKRHKGDTTSETGGSTAWNGKLDCVCHDTTSTHNASRASHAIPDRFVRTKGPHEICKKARFLKLQNVDSAGDGHKDDFTTNPKRKSICQSQLQTPRTTSEDDHHRFFDHPQRVRKSSRRRKQLSGLGEHEGGSMASLPAQNVHDPSPPALTVQRISRHVDFLYQSSNDLWNSADSATSFLEFQLRRTLDEIEVVYNLDSTSIPRDTEIDADLVAEAELKLLNVAFMLRSVRDRPHLLHSRHTAVDLAVIKLDLARQSLSRLRAELKPMVKVSERHFAQDSWILAKLSNASIRVRSLKERRLLIRDSLSLLGTAYADVRLNSDYASIENEHRVLEARSRGISVLSSNRNVQDELRKITWLVETELRALDEDRFYANDFRSRADYVDLPELRDEEMIGMTPTDFIPKSPMAHNLTKASESDLVEFQHRMKSLHQSTELVKALPEDEKTAIASVLRAEIAELLSAIGAGFDSHNPNIRSIVGELISSARAQLELLGPAVSNGDDDGNEQWQHNPRNIRESNVSNDRLPKSPKTQPGTSTSGRLEARTPTKSETWAIMEVDGKSDEITTVPSPVFDVHVPHFVRELAFRLEDLCARIDVTLLPLRARQVELQVPFWRDDEVTSLLHRLNGHRQDVEKLDAELRAALLVEEEHEGLQMIIAKSHETLHVLCDQMVDLKRHLPRDVSGFITSDPRIIVLVDRFYNRMHGRSENWEVVNIWSLDIFKEESAKIVKELERVDPGGACSDAMAKLLTTLSKLEYLKETGSTLAKTNRSSIQAMQTIVDILGSVEVCSRTAVALYMELAARSQHGWRIGGPPEVIQSLQFWIDNSVYPYSDGSHVGLGDFAFSGPQALLTSLHALQVCRTGVRYEDVLRAMFRDIDQKTELEGWPYLSPSDCLADPTEHYESYIKAFLWDIVQRDGVRSAEYVAEREKLLVCNSFGRQQLRVMLGFMESRGFLNDRQDGIHQLGVVTKSEVITDGGFVATAEILDPAIKPRPPATPDRTTIWLYNTNAEGRAQVAVVERNEKTGRLHRTQDLVLVTWQGFARQLRNQGRSRGRHTVKTWGLKVPSSQDDAEVPETDDEEEKEYFEIIEVPKEKHHKKDNVRRHVPQGDSADDVSGESDTIIKGKNGKPIEPRRDERPPSDHESWRIAGDESLIRSLEERTASGYLMGRTFPDEELLCGPEAMLEALKFCLVEETPKLLEFHKLLSKMFVNYSEKGEIPMGTTGQPTEAYAECVRTFIETLHLDSEPEDFYAISNFSPLQLQCVLDFMMMGDDGAPSGMYTTQIDVVPQIAIITPIEGEIESEMLVEAYRLQSSYFVPGAPTMNIWLYMDRSTHEQREGSRPIYHYRELKWQYSIMDIEESKPQVEQWGLKTETAQSQAYRLETALLSGYRHLYKTKIAEQRRKRNRKIWDAIEQGEHSDDQDSAHRSQASLEERASRRGENSRHETRSARAVLEVCTMLSLLDETCTAEVEVFALIRREAIVK